MLAKEYRLRRASDISRVYKRGVYGGASGVLSIKATPSGRSTSRLVIVVGKKVDKRAVVRNRIRRRLTGWIELHWATVKPGYDIVVSVHSDISTIPPSKLEEYLTQALDRVRLFVPSL